MKFEILSDIHKGLQGEGVSVKIGQSKAMSKLNDIIMQKKGAGGQKVQIFCRRPLCLPLKSLLLNYRGKILGGYSPPALPPPSPAPYLTKSTRCTLKSTKIHGIVPRLSLDLQQHPGRLMGLASGIVEVHNRWGIPYGIGTVEWLHILQRFWTF